MRRRHLTETQAAMHVELNGELVERLAREAEERRGATQNNDTAKAKQLASRDADRPQPEPPQKASEAAAEISGVSSATHERIRSARKLVADTEHAEEFDRALLSGSLPARHWRTRR